MTIFAMRVRHAACVSVGLVACATGAQAWQPDFANTVAKQWDEDMDSDGDALDSARSELANNLESSDIVGSDSAFRGHSAWKRAAMVSDEPPALMEYLRDTVPGVQFIARQLRGIARNLAVDLTGDEYDQEWGNGDDYNLDLAQAPAPQPYNQLLDEEEATHVAHL